MGEIQSIVAKYDAAYIERELHSASDTTKFAAVFYADVAEIYDSITRIRNPDRNPTGYSLSDAPILGLLVKIWKLLKPLVGQYEAGNSEVVGILDRPILEFAILASFLMQSDDAVIADYRKCSYKDRLRILRDAEAGSAFFQSKSGIRLVSSVRHKLALESFSVHDFATQKENRWRVQGKSFFDIFKQVEHESLYAVSYGIMSESVHGSWSDSLDHNLSLNEDGTFSVHPFNQVCDISNVTPLLRFTNRPFRLWLTRIDVFDERLRGLLDWVDRVNAALYLKFDAAYDG